MPDLQKSNAADLQKSNTAEIVRLHNEIIGHLRTSLEKAIRIGELLTEQKVGLKHGDFIIWVENNLPFCSRQAQKYIQLFKNKNLISTNANSGSLFTLNSALVEIRDQKWRQTNEERHKKREIQRQQNKKMAEEKPKGDSWEGVSGYGWKCEFSVTGMLNEFPVIHTKCIDPEYHRLKEHSMDNLDFEYPLNQIRSNFKEAGKKLEKLEKKYSPLSYDMYALSWERGPQYPLKKFAEQWAELKKNVEKFLGEIQS